MFVETGVLGGDNGVDDNLGNLGQLEWFAVLDAQLINLVLIGVEHQRALGQFGERRQRIGFPVKRGRHLRKVGSSGYAEGSEAQSGY